MLASPLAVLERRSRAEDMARLGRLAVEQRVVGLVAGHPLNVDGSAGPQAQRAARYAARVATALALPLLLWDEYGSSQEAAARLAHASRRRRRAPLDAEAAAVILQDYLDTRPRRLSCSALLARSGDRPERSDHPITQSPNQPTPITQSPNHPITLSPCHPVTLS